MSEDTQVAGVIMPDADDDEVAGVIIDLADVDEVAREGQDIQPCL